MSSFLSNKNVTPGIKSNILFWQEKSISLLLFSFYLWRVIKWLHLWCNGAVLGAFCVIRSRVDSNTCRKVSRHTLSMINPKKERLVEGSLLHLPQRRQSRSRAHRARGANSIRREWFTCFHFFICICTAYESSKLAHVAHSGVTLLLLFIFRKLSIQFQWVFILH